MPKIICMRGFLASSIGVACAAALALPAALPSGALAAPPAHPRAGAADTSTGGVPIADATPAPPSSGRALPAADGELPGTTQSLPLPDAPSDRSAAPGEDARERALTPREVEPFSLLGVVWDDPDAHLEGRVQVRTRSTVTGTWSDWQELETHHDDHGADRSTPEGAAGRGATAPLWVGRSDAVELRVTSRDDHRHQGGGTSDTLPAGLRLDLVDPGDAPPAEEAPRPEPTRAGAAGAENAALPGPRAEPAVLPELTREETLAELEAARTAGEPAPAAQAAAGPEQRAQPYVGPRPKIVTRKGWGADESLRDKSFAYTGTVKAAFVHHSATGNNYTCAEAPSVIRGIYRYHTKSSGWRDLGYNFMVDKCGTVYEGRAGGVDKAVLGAHTLGFNSNSTGIAVLGSFSSAKPPKAAVDAVAKLTAWKLGLSGANPKGKVTLTSGGSNLYAKGRKVSLHVISGHRDGYSTECPGTRLYGQLGAARSASAKLQGR
ncbi:N-acetylmuramoyl-L-alanine amidase [Streptomyces sp. ADI98-12]|uniref:Secreted protein n=3 Tax=Streptomyces TaxID=1883 RepID=A0A380MPU7_STRGR|nr:N-acetylmuramoyl-L-alanine amidase [Streptomyces sp. ADI98-12]SUO94308.1 Secreted protein [Streptomyces griseus]